MSSIGTVGKVLIIPEFLNNANLTENCVNLKPINNKINKKFLYYYL
jgi:restriction endonuclease S subunit